MKNDGEMRRVPGKTARFAQVVKEAGTPEPYTLWQAPDKDPAFKRALQEHRVMTVLRNLAGNKTDYALVGYHKERNASYLIFPRALTGFEGKKIVGVKYELLEESKPVGTVVKPMPEPKVDYTEPEVLPRPTMAEKTKEKPPKEQPAPKKERARKKFMVSLMVTAEAQVEKEVQAINQAEAKRLAEAKVRENRPDFSKGVMRLKVRKIQTET